MFGLVLEIVDMEIIRFVIGLLIVLFLVGLGLKLVGWVIGTILSLLIPALIIGGGAFLVYRMLGGGKSIGKKDKSLP